MMWPSDGKQDGGEPMMRIIKLVVVLAVLGAAGGAAWRWHQKKAQTVSYNTAPVKRGNLVAVISATGTVEPEEVVDVGAQVAGMINAFGKDNGGKTVDYGSEVDAGTVLAKIDDSVYATEAGQAAAQLQQAKALVAVSEASLVQLKAKLDQAQRDWERAKKIGPSNALATSSYDAYKAAYESAVANVAVGEATIRQALAAVAQAEANVARAQLNLNYCVIKSPVKGVIIDRRVNIGQTVVASLNAPSLFLIAKDLRRIQIWVAVNEADIGTMKFGLPVTFTVDAYPGEVFTGEVGQVRLNATMSQNVVTYTVEVNTDNSSGRLLPYLTANVRFQVEHRENVLMVPNAALRWVPRPELVAPAAGAAHADEPREGVREGPLTNLPKGAVWLKDGPFVRPLRVSIGVSDGTMTEVSGDSLEEGAQVILSEARASAHNGTTQEGSASAGSNPFVPQMMGSRR